MISVIMPLYNNEKYVAEAIQSVINQSYTDWELIIINDASTDNSQQIAENISKTDTRISLINLKENKGVSYARNLGIKKSKGEYISFLDSDDLWDKDFLKLLFNKIIKKNIYFVYARYAWLMSNNAIQNCSINIQNGNLISYIYKNKNRYELLFPFHIGSILLRKKILEEKHIFFPEDQNLFEDALFICKLLCIEKATPIDKVLMYYRQHNTSTFHKKFKPIDYIQEIIFWEKLLDFVKNIQDKALEIKLKEIISYRTYRIILSMIKNKFINESIESIDKYNLYLKYYISRKYIKLNDKIRCILSLSQKKIILKLLSYL